MCPLLVVRVLVLCPEQWETEGRFSKSGNALFLSTQTNFNAINKLLSGQDTINFDVKLSFASYGQLVRLHLNFQPFPEKLS